MRAFVTIGLALLVAACSRPAPLAAPPGGTLELIRSISRIEGNALLMLAGVQNVSVRYDVDCYRVTYHVRGAGRRDVLASGLLALPRGVPARRLVSFQHGTTTSRELVPSELDQTGIAAAVLIAGNGHALIAPDYLGLGGSSPPHAYLVADEEARAVIAMIDFARQVHGVPQGPVFLSGFSQGGQATMAALRALEASGEDVLAAAPVAGPYNVRGISLGVALRGDAPSDALYLAYMAWGYAHHYGHPLESVLTPNYARVVEGLFAAPNAPDVIIAALPDNPRSMFTEAFLDAFDTNGPHWFLDALAENNVSDWRPRAPVRLYYGSRDIDVSPEEARRAALGMRARGADVTAVDLGPLGHDNSMLVAAPLMLAWLDQLEARAPD
jgi:pimeloyl-ACP methyl ester carboxylesterase